MQYLREDIVNQACIIGVKINESGQEDAQMDNDKEAMKAQYVSMIAYENCNGKVTVGTIEPQTKLQTRRIGFKK